METFIFPIVNNSTKKTVNVSKSEVRNYNNVDYLKLEKANSWKKFLINYNHKSSNVSLISPVLSTVTFVKKKYSVSKKETLCLIHFHHFAAHSIYKNIACPNALVISFQDFNIDKQKKLLKEIKKNHIPVNSVEFDSALYRDGTQKISDFNVDELITKWRNEEYEYSTPLLKKGNKLFEIQSDLKIGFIFIDSREGKLLFNKPWYWFNPERFLSNHNNGIIVSLSEDIDIDFSIDSNTFGDHIWYDGGAKSDYSCEVKMGSLFNIPKKTISIPFPINHLGSKDEMLYLDGGILVDGKSYTTHVGDKQLSGLVFKKGDYVMHVNQEKNKHYFIKYHDNGSSGGVSKVTVPLTSKKIKIEITTEEKKHLNFSLISIDYEELEIKNAIKKCKKSNKELEKWLNANNRTLPLFQLIESFSTGSSKFRDEVLDKALDEKVYKKYKEEYRSLKDKAQINIKKLSRLYEKYCLESLQGIVNEHTEGKAKLVIEAFQIIMTNSEGYKKLMDFHGNWKRQLLDSYNQDTIIDFETFYSIVKVIKKPDVLDLLLHFKVFGLDALFVKKHYSKFYDYDLANGTYSSNALTMWEGSLKLDAKILTGIQNNFEGKLEVSAEKVNLPSKYINSSTKIRGPEITIKKFVIKGSTFKKFKGFLNYSSLAIEIYKLPSLFIEALKNNDFESWNKVTEKSLRIGQQISNTYLEISQRNSPVFAQRSLSGKLFFPFLYISLIYDIKTFESDIKQGNDITAYANITSSVISFGLGGLALLGLVPFGLGIAGAFLTISLSIIAQVFDDSKAVSDFKNMYFGQKKPKGPNYSHWIGQYHLQLAHALGYAIPIENATIKNKTNPVKNIITFSLPKNHYKEYSRVLIEFKANTKLNSTYEPKKLDLGIIDKYGIGFLLQPFKLKVDINTPTDTYPKLYGGFLPSNNNSSPSNKRTHRICTGGGFSINVKESSSKKTYEIEVVFNAYHFRTKNSGGEAYLIREINWASIFVSFPSKKEKKKEYSIISNKELDEKYMNMKHDYNFGTTTSAILITKG